MKKRLILNERGYAMIEIVFLISIIAIFSSLAIPNVFNSFKTVYVEYEIRNLYGELRFMQTASRIMNFNNEDIFQNAMSNKKIVYLYTNIFDDKYSLVIRSDLIRKHNLAPNFTFNNKDHVRFLNEGIMHVDKGVRGNIFLKRNSEDCKPLIKFDSVGRIRIIYNN